MNAEFRANEAGNEIVHEAANEADVAEQQRELREDAESADLDEVPSADVEADPADLQEQRRAVPSEEEDWPDA